MKKMLKLFGSLFLLAAIFTGCSQNSADPNKDDGETVEQFIAKLNAWGSGVSTDGQYSLTITSESFIIKVKDSSDNFVYIGGDEESSTSSLSQFHKIANNQYQLKEGLICTIDGTQVKIFFNQELPENFPIPSELIFIKNTSN